MVHTFHEIQTMGAERGVEVGVAFVANHVDDQRYQCNGDRAHLAIGMAELSLASHVLNRVGEDSSWLQEKCYSFDKGQPRNASDADADDAPHNALLMRRMLSHEGDEDAFRRLARQAIVRFDGDTGESDRKSPDMSSFKDVEKHYGYTTPLLALGVIEDFANVRTPAYRNAIRGMTYKPAPFGVRQYFAPATNPNIVINKLGIYDNGPLHMRHDIGLIYNDKRLRVLYAILTTTDERKMPETADRASGVAVAEQLISHAAETLSVVASL